MACEKCGKEIPAGGMTFHIISAETGASINVCQSCMLSRYGGGESEPATEGGEAPGEGCFGKAAVLLAIFVGSSVLAGSALLSCFFGR